MAHKLLEELNMKERPPWEWNPNSQYQEQWAKEREEFGFDEREVWSLDYTWHIWLYERVKYFREYTPVDFQYHMIHYKGDLYSQGQLIDMLLERLKWALEHDTICLEGEEYEYYHEIEYIWAVLCPTMWW